VKDLLGRDLRHKDRGSRLAIRAAQPALADAGLLDGDDFRGAVDRTAVVVSSNFGILDNVCECADIIAQKSVTGLSPMGLPQTSINVIAGSLAIRFGLRGPNVTVTNGSTSGLDAVHWARNLIAADRADTAVVVGVEPAGEAVAKLLGSECVDAAAAVVLESAEGAAARRASARATVASYSRAHDLGTAITRVRERADQPIGLWLLPEQTAEAPAGDGRADAFFGTAVPRTLSLDWLGHSSGAHGVLQCAASVAYLDAAGSGDALATTGGSAGGAAALLLTGAPA